MTNDDLNRISSLPDSMSCEQVEKEFAMLIQSIGAEPLANEFLLIMTALSELADRQWATYELLNNQIKDKIEEIAIKVWQQNSLDSTEKLICVIGRIGLTNAWSYLVSIKPSTLSPEVTDEIASAIIEIGDSVGDPYAGMR